MKNAPNPKYFLWKLYFWFLMAFMIPSYLWQGFSRIWEIIDLLIITMAMFGFFGFCWQKRISSAMTWKIFFVIFVAWNIFQQYFLPWSEVALEAMEKDMGGLSQQAIATMNIVIFLPLFIALFLYAFKNKEVSKAL